MLVALVGINVYVFFFNRGTAPREILNMQSTSKTFESTRQEALAADVRKAGELVASSSGAKRASRSGPRPVTRGERQRGEPAGAGQRPSPAPRPRFKHPVRAPARAGRATRPARAASPASRSRSRPRPKARRRRRRPAAGVEKTFAANDTLGAGDGARRVRQRRRQRHRRAHQAGRSAQHPGRPEVRRPRPATTARRTRSSTSRRPRCAIWSSATTATRAASGTGRARKLEANVEIRIVEAGGTVESSLYESVQKTGESTTLVGQLVELFAWDVNFYIDTHPGDHWKVRDREAVPGRPVLQVRARAGGRIRRQGRHLPRLLLGGRRTRRATARASTTTKRARRCRRAC